MPPNDNVDRFLCYYMLRGKKMCKETYRLISFGIFQINLMEAVEISSLV